MYEVRLPQWGMGMDEGTVLSWNFQVGDVVREGEVLGIIEAAKVETEFESPVSGTVAEVSVAEGATVPIGTTLLLIDES